jgi:hypothetical protein
VGDVVITLAERTVGYFLDQIAALHLASLDQWQKNQVLQRELTRCNKKLHRRRLRARKERERLEMTLQARVNTCGNCMGKVKCP